MYEGSPVYVVSANLKDRKYSPYCPSHNTEKVSFKLYIDVDDYSIYKIEYQPVPLVINSIKNVQNIVTNSKGPVKTYCEGGKGKNVIEFRKYNNKLYPHYMTHMNYVIDYDTVTNKTYVNQHVLELVITQVDPEEKQEPAKKSVMHPWKSLESQVTKYDAAFWKNYNMIKLSSMDRQLILDLEKDLTLEEQFQKRTFAEIERNKINAFKVENNN
jgi:hypothetical protein